MVTLIVIMKMKIENQGPPLEAWHCAGSGLGEERGSFGASRRFFQVAAMILWMLFFLPLFIFSCQISFLSILFISLSFLSLFLCTAISTREEVEKLQEKLNGRNLQELLDAIEAEGFEPEGWSSEVGCQ